jgi:hypothetical protein
MEQADENARTGAPGGEERDEARASSGQMAGQAGQDGASDMEEAVRRRAYEMYVARGGQPGREFDDWYAAEQEVRAQRAAAPAAGQRESGQRESGQREPDTGARGGMEETSAEQGERAASPRKRSAPSRRSRPRGEG